MTQNARTKKYSLKFYTAPDNANGEKEYDLNLPVTCSMLSWVLTGYSRWEVDDNTNSDNESALVESEEEESELSGSVSVAGRGQVSARSAVSSCVAAQPAGCQLQQGSQLTAPDL